MKTRKKICFVATVDFAVTAFLIDHLRELDKSYDVTVITKTSNLNFLSDYKIYANVINLKIAREIHLLSDIYCLFKLIQIFIKIRFSCVHSITPKAGLLGMLAAKLCFVPMRVHLFTGQVWISSIGLERLLLKYLDILLGMLTTHNLVDSPSQRDFLVGEGVLSSNKALVFGNGSVAGVDLVKFQPKKNIARSVNKELNLPDDSFVFMYLGRLVKDKGVLDLAKAFSELNASNAYLVFVGSDEVKLSRQIINICANKIQNIRLVGFTKEPQKSLASADVLCLPSYREGFGTVVIEAAAMGVPTIASDIYGITDAIENNKTGLLHEVGDILCIKTLMELVLLNSSLLRRLGRAARDRAVTKFDTNLLTDEWLKFYRKNIT